MKRLVCAVSINEMIILKCKNKNGLCTPFEGLFRGMEV